MIDWKTWGVNPPPSAVSELERLKDSNVHPFSVVAVDLNKQLQQMLKSHGPFLVRAFREAKPNATMDDVMFATLQPIVTAVFGEWIAAQPRNSTNVVDMKVVLPQFAQMCVDAVNAMALQSNAQNARDDAGKVKLQ